jgi:hypothetical protein
MTRTTITKTGSNEVTLRAIDPFTGEATTRVFWITHSGGYVREGERHNADDRQVCNGLGHRGPTLTAQDGDDLLRTIRVEWKAYKRDAEKAVSFA